MSGLGQVTIHDDTCTLRFRRELPHPPEEVWSALTRPERMADWLARAEITPGEGGRVELDFGDGGVEGGRITVWDPPHALSYEWNFVGERPSLVHWRLSATGGGTVLELEHELLETGAASGYGAGWHAHLDQLAGHLAGDVPAWEPRFDELHPRYRELVEAGACPS